MTPAPGKPAIGDYAVIGDCRCAALVSRWGSIDWLCQPRVDSPSVFAALLDADRGGRFRIAPEGASEASRRYLGDTNVLETTFRTGGGTVRLVDLMPVGDESVLQSQLRPDHQILRLVECLAGEVDVEVRCDPRPGYAAATPRAADRGALGIHWEHKGDMYILRSDIPVRPSTAEPGAYGRERLHAGDRRLLAFAFERGEPAVTPPLGDAGLRAIDESLEWWEGWSAMTTYEGPFREAVRRSALVLKLMVFAPSGALVAAPTTSLPEEVGGVRNWDYRYCWLRDAALTLRALMDVGHPREAAAFLDWMLHSTRLTRPELQVVYDVYGERRLPERVLPNLRGYRDNRPVRVGNAASDQLQLDVYGHTVEAAYAFVQRGGTLDPAAMRLLVDAGRTVVRRWREPDEGLWEVRSGRAPHTHSRALCWLALRRLIQLHEQGSLTGVPVDRFRSECDAIRADIELHGWSERRQSYVAVYGDDRLDASLLALALYGYTDARAARMRSTYARIREELGEGSLLWRYRHEDGLPGREGAFGICSFWAVEYLALCGEHGHAASEMARLLRYANDVGLFGEQIDPATGAPLGNFPQAFTHIGLISATLAINRSQDGGHRTEGV